MSPTPEKVAEHWLRTFQTNVLREMNRQALTQRDLADRAGLRSHTSVHRWLHCDESPRLLTITRVANALGVTPLSLLTPPKESR